MLWALFLPQKAMDEASLSVAAEVALPDDVYY